jgi:hypothetical protein
MVGWLRWSVPALMLCWALGWPGLATVAAPLLHEGPPRRSGDRDIRSNSLSD